MSTKTDTVRSDSDSTAKQVVIIGGGATGTLVATNLLRSDPNVKISIFEPSGRLGFGVAYGTTDDRHLLNVRANNMFAFPDRPNDLLDWAAEVGRPLAPTDFLPRREYADYLRHRLAEVNSDRLEIVAEPVTDVVPVEGGYRVVGSDGASRIAPDVVLAYGVAAPGPLVVAGAEVPDAPWYVANPWASDWLADLPEDATVVIIGSRLTAIDVALSVLTDAPNRKVVFVSRKGELPEAHLDGLGAPWTSPIPAGPLTADQLAAMMAEQIDAAAKQGADWRQVVDGLRSSTHDIWSRLSLAERKRFLTEYDPWWEVHRHRMAPQIAEWLTRMQADGRLTIRGGGIDGLKDDGSTVEVQTGGEKIVANALVNCTGPQTDITKISNPLIDALLRRDLAAPGPLHLGLACTPDGQVLNSAGRIVPGLFTVGPPRMDALFETFAMPEIRVQAAETAARLVA